MRTRTLLWIEWMLLVSPTWMGTACGGSESVRFAPSRSDSGSDSPTGGGGTAAGGAGGTDDSGGAAGNSGGAAGAAGTNGGSGGTAGGPGSGGSGGGPGSGGSGGSGGGGTAGSSGAAGNGGAAGRSGASGAGGAAGTSGASGAGGTSGGSGGAAGGNAGQAGMAGGNLDSGLDGDASTTDVAADGDVTIDGAGDAGCPTVFGTYAINNADGNCGDLDENAPQEIRGTVQACALHFISVVDGGIGAINGDAVLGADGTFSGATLIEGTVTRTPCSGSWNENEEEITVICGTGADECSVELRRSGP